MRTILCVLCALSLAGFAPAATAQEISIPDPGLNAAVRAALQKPAGPLSEQDMLNLTVLNAHDRNISSLAGLEAARNLNTLLLFSNHLTNFSLPNLTNLVSLDLSQNLLTNLALPDGMTHLFSLVISDNPLGQLSLPAGLTGLEELDLQSSQLISFTLPSGLTSLGVLDLGFNALTNFTLPSGLTNLDLLRLSGNWLTNFTVPAGLTRLTQLYLDQNQLSSFTLPAGLTNLHVLDLFFNQITDLSLPPDQRNLISLDLDSNRLTSLNLPTNLAGLSVLHARANQLTNFDLPADLRALRLLDLAENQLRNVNMPAGLYLLETLRISGNTNLTDLTLSVGMTNLSAIFLRSNGLTNLTLPPDLHRLGSLDALGNRLASLTLPTGLVNLTNLFLGGNQLTTLTLPPDITRSNWLVLDGNPLTQLVLSAPLATDYLADTVAVLRNAGVHVFTYPLTVQLAPTPQSPRGSFGFSVTGPPGDYTLLSSTNLVDWTLLGTSHIPLGAIVVTDTMAQFSPQKFYRAQLQVGPANMVFIPPNTFTMGSPATELHRQPNEGPQTTVTLTHGYWIGKFEVTEAEYLSIMNTNPSFFPGDLSRPISSVSWADATNYCWLLTQRELAAGRIPRGSQYRLPTEAEWECADRAGTRTRFSYGDDPDYTNLSNYAWYILNSGFPSTLTLHPVGQKLPNPWGLYDMEGNVWEWTNDWLGDLPGGTVTDPRGPSSNATGLKIVRGGSYDFDVTDCRSARRFFFPLTFNDTDIGFRIVLLMGEL